MSDSNGQVQAEPDIEGEHHVAVTIKFKVYGYKYQLYDFFQRVLKENRLQFKDAIEAFDVEVFE